MPNVAFSRASARRLQGGVMPRPPRVQADGADDPAPFIDQDQAPCGLRFPRRNIPGFRGVAQTAPQGREAAGP